MSAQHTPSPWVVVQASWDEDTSDVRYTLEGVKVAKVADAKLIAAAPELLEALEAIVVLFEGASGAGANHWEQFSEYRSARVVIAKAKGETK